jgi:hypothetical protein
LYYRGEAKKSSSSGSSDFLGESVCKEALPIRP